MYKLYVPKNKLYQISYTVQNFGTQGEDLMRINYVPKNKLYQISNTVLVSGKVIKLEGFKRKK